MRTANTAHATFGPLLRSLRAERSLSQERLAHDAEVSPRHLSFLETGRAAPSREMVLVLASALDLPLRDRNALLGAAGFAPVYRESSLSDASMAPVRAALDHLLAGFEPNAAVLMDRLSNVLAMNQGAQRLMSWVYAGRTPPMPAMTNVMHALFHPEGLRGAMVDWEDVARALVARAQRDLALRPDAEARALLEAVLAYPGVPADIRSPRTLDAAMPFVAVHLRRGEVSLRLFTVLTTLGTPLDVTAEELVVEAYFPADDASARLLRDLATS